MVLLLAIRMPKNIFYREIIIFINKKYYLRFWGGVRDAKCPAVYAGSSPPDKTGKMQIPLCLTGYLFKIFFS